MEGDILTIYSNVTQGSGAVILYIGVWRVEKSDKNGDCACIHKLLPILVWIRMQCQSRDWLGRNNPPECVMFNRAPVALR